MAGGMVHKAQGADGGTTYYTTTPWVVSTQMQSFHPQAVPPAHQDARGGGGGAVIAQQQQQHGGGMLVNPIGGGADAGGGAALAQMGGGMVPDAFGPTPTAFTKLSAPARDNAAAASVSYATCLPDGLAVNRFAAQGAVQPAGGVFGVQQRHMVAGGASHHHLAPLGVALTQPTHAVLGNTTHPMVPAASRHAVEPDHCPAVGLYTKKTPQPPVTRRFYNLPEDAIVLCNFNQLYVKIPLLYKKNHFYCPTIWCRFSFCKNPKGGRGSFSTVQQKITVNK